MSRHRSVDNCRRCGGEFIPSTTLHHLCSICSHLGDRKSFCPKCGGPMHEGCQQCRECRFKPFRSRHFCPICGKPKSLAAKLCNPCSGKRRSGANHPCWKGGRYLNSGGYVMLYAPEHPRAGSNGYVREHIKIWMDNYGPVTQGHVIHHLNGVKSDNRLDNLALTPIGKHQTLALIHAMQNRIARLEALL